MVVIVRSGAVDHRLCTLMLVAVMILHGGSALELCLCVQAALPTEPGVVCCWKGDVHASKRLAMLFAFFCFHMCMSSGRDC